jgi:hypothetical protein
MLVLSHSILHGTKKIEKLLEDTYYAMEVPVEEAPEEAIA